MANLFVFIYLASPFWVLAFAFLAHHRIYRWVSFAVCFFFFTVEPIGTSIVDHAADGGLGTLLSMGVAAFAALISAVLLIVIKDKSRRIFFSVMLGSAVVGFLGAWLVR
jgi:hypothetical protein